MKVSSSETKINCSSNCFVNSRHAWRSIGVVYYVATSVLRNRSHCVQSVKYNGEWVRFSSSSIKELIRLTLRSNKKNETTSLSQENKNYWFCTAVTATGLFLSTLLLEGKFLYLTQIFDSIIFAKTWFGTEYKVKTEISAEMLCWPLQPQQNQVVIVYRTVNNYFLPNMQFICMADHLRL